jgi:general secretion pathway protein B
MSLILDALRKMEQDRKSRQAAAQEMRSQVLRYRAPVAPRQAKPYAMLALAVLLVSGGVGAGILLKGNRQPPQMVAEPMVAAAQSTPGPGPFSPPAATAPTAVPAPATPAAPSAVSVPAAAAPSAVPAQVAPAAPTPASPASSRGKGKGEPAPVLATTVTPDAAPPRTAEAPASRRSRRAAGKSSVAAALPAQATAARTEVLQGAPDIAVSGIAWQDERNLRRAVLNGTLVGEGAQVAGARVVEIKENRVRLSRGGQLFDVPLNSGFGR